MGYIKSVGNDQMKMNCIFYQKLKCVVET